MKLLVLSDSHRNKIGLRMAIERNLDAEALIFLGDGENDIEELQYEIPEIAQMRTYIVRGNCDMFSGRPIEIEDVLNGKKIFCSHGHYQYVKEGYSGIKNVAKETGADLVMFGHTHKQTLFEANGTIFFNPGAVRNGCYGVVTIGDDGKISCEFCRI